MPRSFLSLRPEHASRLYIAAIALSLALAFTREGPAEIGALGSELYRQVLVLAALSALPLAVGHRLFLRLACGRGAGAAAPGIAAWTWLVAVLVATLTRPILEPSHFHEASPAATLVASIASTLAYAVLALATIAVTARWVALPALRTLVGSGVFVGAAAAVAGAALGVQDAIADMLAPAAASFTLPVTVYSYSNATPGSPLLEPVFWAGLAAVLVGLDVLTHRPEATPAPGIPARLLALTATGLGLLGLALSFRPHALVHGSWDTSVDAATFHGLVLAPLLVLAAVALPGGAASRYAGRARSVAALLASVGALGLVGVELILAQPMGWWNAPSAGASIPELPLPAHILGVVAAAGIITTLLLGLTHRADPDGQPLGPAQK